MENLAFNSVGKSSIQLGTLKFQMNLNIQEEKKKRLNVKNLGGSFLKKPWGEDCPLLASF